MGIRELQPEVVVLFVLIVIAANVQQPTFRGVIGVTLCIVVCYTLNELLSLKRMGLGYWK
jgi:1,4-dihydroxy-2-naphthoate octaprenyltransferase